jgi:hypothetical protein
MQHLLEVLQYQPVLNRSCNVWRLSRIEGTPMPGNVTTTF